MTSIQKNLRHFLDFLVWGTFVIYVTGGFYVREKPVLAYPKDIFHICITGLVLGLIFKVDLAQLTLVRSFQELNGVFAKRTRPRTWGAWIVTVSVAYLGLLFILTPCLRHWSYGTWRWDLGAIQQIIWRGGHGFGLTSTIITNSAASPLHFIKQQHLELWLYVIAYFYRVLPHTEILLVIQSLALLGCAVPLYKIARRLLPDSNLPMAVIVMFWCNQNLHRVNVWDFHENAFVSFFSLWAFYFFIERRWFGVIIFTLGTASFKEDAWVIAGGMACYFCFTEKKYFLGVLSALSGFLFFATYGALFTVQAISLGDRYGYLGQNMHEAAATISRRPWVFLKQLFSWPNLIFFRDIFLMGGGLWLAADWALITLAPIFFEISLSTYAPARSLNGHYVIALMGCLFYGVCLGLKNISANEKTHTYLKPLVTGALLLSLWPLEYSEPANVQYLLRTEGFKKRDCYAQLLAPLPNDAPLYVNDPFTTHVANRAIILKYEPGTPVTLAGAYAIFDENQPLPQNTTLVTQGCGYKMARLIDSRR